MTAARTKPSVIEWHLAKLVEAVPEFANECRHCGVVAGPCVTPTGRPTETHSVRLTQTGAS